jgi:transposase, IS5 family
MSPHVERDVHRRHVGCRFLCAHQRQGAVKCQFGYRKVRYRGIAKNGAQVFSLLALANLYLARRTLASA